MMSIKKPLSFAITCALCIVQHHTKLHGSHRASKVGCAVCALLARCNNSQAGDAALPLGLALCGGSHFSDALFQPAFAMEGQGNKTFNILFSILVLISTVLIKISIH